MPTQTIRLRVADVAARHLAIDHTIHAVAGDRLVLRMPVWCPGSYVVRDYAGLVSRFEAVMGEEPLAFRKTDKTTWEIDCPGGGDVTVRYRVYAPKLTVRSNDVSHDHAFVHPPGTFLAVDGRESEEILLHVEAPEKWTVSAALPVDRGRFVARDYDHLLDSPLEIGPHEVHVFEVADRSHEFVVHGSGNADVARILDDTEKIVRHQVEFFGDAPPYDRYLFVLHLVHEGGGGLEHDDCCVLGWPKLGFRPEAEYRKFLTLVAHEFFHVWNVRRIRPEVLSRYDYQREVYTRLLWVFEGFTTYYDEVIPVRAGCYGPKVMLGHLADHVAKERTRPGGEIQSLEDNSFDTWIGLYRTNPDTPNSQSHYYLKGLLVAWKLDLLLRARTRDARSLDDVMRHLWTEYGQPKRGVPEGAMGEIIAAVTGVDVEEFLRAHVESPGPLHYDDVLDHVGLRLRRKSTPPDKPTPAWLGATFENREDGARLKVVEHGGPAHAAGLMADDVLIAFDGHRVGRGLKERLEQYAPGEGARCTLFRRDRLIDVRFTFGEDPVGEMEIVTVEAPNSAQDAAFQAWTGHALADLAPATDSSDETERKPDRARSGDVV